MGRSVTMGGAGPILPENILAYQQLHDVKFTPWELEVIEAFDAVALEAMREQQDKKP